MDESLVLEQLDDLIKSIEALSKMVGLEVEVAFILKSEDEFKKRKRKGRIVKVSKVNSWNKFPPYFLMIEIRERHSVDIYFFANTQHIISIKNLATNEFLYRLNKKKLAKK